MKGAGRYVHVLNGLDPAGHDSDAIRGIRDQRTGVRQHVPLLVAGSNLPAACLRRWAREVESLTLVFALANAQWNEIEKVAPVWGKRLRQISSEEALESFLVSDVRPVLADKWPLALERLKQTNQIRPSLLKYVLARISQHVDSECGKSNELSQYLKRDVTIEHVLPQSLPERVREGFADESTSRAMVHWLGNLTLLHRTPNSSGGDDDFEAKQGIYERSDFELTRSLVQDLELGKRTKLGRTAERYGLRPFKSWTSQEAIERHASLLIVFRAIWGGP